MFRISELIETESRLMFEGGVVGEGNGKGLLNEYKVFFWGDEMFWSNGYPVL